MEAARNIHKYRKKENKTVTVKKLYVPFLLRDTIFNVTWERVKYHNENIKIIYIILRNYL